MHFCGREGSFRKDNITCECMIKVEPCAMGLNLHVSRMECVRSRRQVHTTSNQRLLVAPSAQRSKPYGMHTHVAIHMHATSRQHSTDCNTGRTWCYIYR